MSNVVNRNNQVAKPKFSQVIQSDAIQGLIANTLGDREQVRTFIASISSAVATNPTLQECTPNSVITSALLGESLKLAHSPQMGHYYIVPYNNKKANTKEGQFQIG